MSIPIKPWSFSSLDTFTTCARKYHEETILKSVVNEETEAQRQGIRAHKALEDRLTTGTELPPGLAFYEGLCQELQEMPGKLMVERKVGINKRLEPCGFFDRDVWWRGILDVHHVQPNGHATILDWKNGKPHNKMRQLHLFALYAFLEGQIQVETAFHWLQSKTRTRIVMHSAQRDQILRGLVPDLTSYKEAFAFDQWPPTRNFLCKNYCGVTECEFHGKGLNERV